MTGESQVIRYCTTFDGVNLAYATIGSGPALLESAYGFNHLEHGLRNSLRRHWIAALSQGRRYVRYDARGCGLSDRDVPEVSFEALVRDLEAIADTAKLERFALIGHSHGAAVAVAYAARHPERVTRLVLYGGYARGYLRRGLGPEAVEKALLYTKIAEIGCEADDPTFRRMFASRYLPDADEEMLAEHDALWRAAYTPSSIARFTQMTDQIDLRDVAPSVACPSLVLHTAHDRGVPVEEGRLLAHLLPRSRFVSLQSRNHFIRADEPAWAQFVDEVRSFLAGATAAGDAFAALTMRERELLEYLSRGLDNHQIAAHLDLSEKTVRNMVSSVLDKLQVETRAQAIVRAREAGYGAAS